MSETLATDGRASDDAVSFPPGRYGRRRERRNGRRPAIAALLSVAVVAAGLAASWHMYSQYGHGNFTSKLLAYDDATPGQVSITFEVYKPEDEAAICRVRSRDMDGAEIGAAEVHLPAGDTTRVETTYTLPVAGEPNTGEVQRCWQADLPHTPSPPHRSPVGGLFATCGQSHGRHVQSTDRNIRRIWKPWQPTLTKAHG